MMRWTKIAILTTVIGGMACGGTTGGDVEGEGPASMPTTGDMAVIGMATDPDTFFPQSSNSVGSSDIYSNNIYKYLMASEPDFIHFKPALADSYRFAPDSMYVDFFINPAAAWHDGTPFTAADVVFGHQVCNADEINWSARSWLEHITSVEALDDLTVRFTYDQPYMYQVLDANVCFPLPEHVLGDVPFEDMPNHAIARQPMGNGPWRFVSWVPNQEIVLEANESYFRGRPYLNRLVYRIIPDQTALAVQMESGDVDAVPRFQSSFYPRLEANPDVQVFSYPGRSYTYLAFNTEDPKFADKAVRQAVTMAIDRQQIVDALLYGQAIVGTQPMIRTIWAHDPSIEPYPFDPDSAGRMLAEAGWVDTDGDGVRDKDGEPFSVTFSTNADNTLRVDIVTVVQEQLKAVGIDVTPRTLEFNSFIERLMEHEYEAAVGGWSVGVKAAQTSIFGTGELFNFVGAANARLDSLMLAAESERDFDRAGEIWAVAQREIVDQAYYAYLFELNDLLAVGSRFEGVEPTAYGWSDGIENWYVPEGRQKYDIPLGSAPTATAGDGADDTVR